MKNVFCATSLREFWGRFEEDCVWVLRLEMVEAMSAPSHSICPHPAAGLVIPVTLNVWRRRCAMERGDPRLTKNQGLRSIDSWKRLVARVGQHCDVYRQWSPACLPDLGRNPKPNALRQYVGLLPGAGAKLDRRPRVVKSRLRGKLLSPFV